MWLFRVSGVFLMTKGVHTAKYITTVFDLWGVPMQYWQPPEAHM